MCGEKDVVGEAEERERESERERERERERAGRLRGEGRCSAELERTPRAQPSIGLPWKPHSSPACIPTDCSDSLLLSISLLASLFFHPVFFIPLLIRVFVVFSLPLFLSLSLCLSLFALFLHRAHTRIKHIRDDAHSASKLISDALLSLSLPLSLSFSLSVAR